ncbi:ribonuclease H-like domain-containing protein [Tanacetum coccineum]
MTSPIPPPFSMPSPSQTFSVPSTSEPVNTFFVQRETKARTILLQSLPEDHMANFHHLDDARDIWLTVKARFGGNDESKKMRKSMLKQEFSEFRVSESEGLHKGYDREACCWILKQDHEGEDEEKGMAQVYGMIVGNDDDAAGDASGDVSDDCANLLYGLSSQVKLEESKARSKFGLGFRETFGSDEVFDPSAPSIFDTTPEGVEGKNLYDRFVKAVGMHAVPLPIYLNIHASSPTKPDLIYTRYYANIPSFVPRAAYVPASSRNPPASISAGSAFPAGSRNRPASVSVGRPFSADNPHKNKDLGIVDSGCSRSMTGNKEKLDDFVKIIGGTVTFGGGDGKITGKGTIRTSQLNFENGIKRDYSNARTPQQNGVAERKNRTLIEAARTMLADSNFPTMFWTEAVSTACYVLNKVLVTHPHNKTPYELLSGKVPNISHLKPFGCHVTILNTSDHLGKFEGKTDEGFIVGAWVKSGCGYLTLTIWTDSLGYTRFKSNQPASTQDPHIHAGTQDDSDSECDEQVIVVPSFPSNRFQVLRFMKLLTCGGVILTYAKKLAGFKDKDMELRYSENISTGTAEPFPTVIEPVHADETSLPPGHSLGSSDTFSRFSLSFDLQIPNPQLQRWGHIQPSSTGLVDDIIFWSTKKAWCDKFEVLMKREFEMSVMGELTFFLGLQVKQKPDGIFISQDKSRIRFTHYLTASRHDFMLKCVHAYSDRICGSMVIESTMVDVVLGRRLMSHGSVKSTIVVYFFMKPDNVAAANCYGQEPMSLILTFSLPQMWKWKHLGGSFHTTPPRSTQVPPVGPTLGGAEDLATLTALSSLVSELVQKADVCLDVIVDVSPGTDIPPSPPLPTDMSAGVSSGVSTSLKSLVLQCVLHLNSFITVRDARMGKGVAVEEPTLTHDKTFKQLEEERLDAAWDIILARLQVNLDLSSTIFGVEFTDDDFAARMVELVNTRRKELAEQWAKEQRESPMTPSQLRQYMRTYVKNQGPAIISMEEKAQNASLLKKVEYQMKRLGRKGVHTCQSSIPIKEGDPKAEHKVCIKYASDADSAFDNNTPVNLYPVVDWELLPTGLGSINTFYRLDNSRNYFTRLGKVFVGVVCSLGDLKTVVDSIYISLWERSILLLNLSKDARFIAGRKFVHGHSGGNDNLYIAVHVLKVAAFWCSFCHNLYVAANKKGTPFSAIFRFSIIKYGVGFKMLLFNPLEFSKKDLSRNLKYVVPTGRVKVPAGRYVVPTGKDNVIVSAGRSKVIPAGRTILVLNGNNRKKTGRDPKGNIMILPPVSVEEHIAVQRETKARTILLQSLHEDHMADFHHLDDARDIWLAVKAKELEEFVKS